MSNLLVELTKFDRSNLVELSKFDRSNLVSGIYKIYQDIFLYIVIKICFFDVKFNDQGGVGPHVLASSCVSTVLHTYVSNTYYTCFGFVSMFRTYVFQTFCFDAPSIHILIGFRLVGVYSAH